MTRRGFSLLEVLLSLAILGTCLAAISMLVRLGSRGAVEARELTTAQLLCEAKVAEISTGILPPDPGGPWQFDLPEHADWVFYVDQQPLPQPGLIAIMVTVTQQLPAGSMQRPLEFSLVRWIQDPALELTEPPSADSIGTTTTTSSSGGSSGM